MKRMLMVACFGALATSAVAGAQSATSMKMPNKSAGAAASHTGCLESSAGGFVLTHVDMGHEMAMADKQMGSDGMAMAHDGNGMRRMSEGHMMHDSVRLTGLSSLGKHVGQKVTVKGSASHASTNGMRAEAAFAVTSLKVVAKSCS